MNLMNESRAQTKDKHNDKHDDNHLLTSDQCEREDRKESNVANRHNRQENTDCQSELESSIMPMAQDMQIMKDKMHINEAKSSH